MAVVRRDRGGGGGRGHRKDQWWRKETWLGVVNTHHNIEMVYYGSVLPKPVYHQTSVWEHRGSQFGCRQSCYGKKCLSRLTKLWASILYLTTLSGWYLHNQPHVSQVTDKGDSVLNKSLLSFPEWITFENQGSTIILSTNVNPINSIKTERLGKKVLLRILRLTRSHLRPGQIFVNTPVGPHGSGTLKRFLQNSIKHIASVHLTN